MTGFPRPAGFPMVDFPWGVGVRAGDLKGNIISKLRSTTHPGSFNFQFCGQVCLIKNTC